MVKKTVVTTETDTDAPGSEVEIEGAPDPNEMEPDAIRELLAVSDTTEVRWKVDCIAPPEKSGYCATYNSGDLSLDTIREQWGGGKFKITGWDALGKYVGRRTVLIKETPKALIAQGPQLGELAALLSAGKNDSQNILLTMIKSQSDMLTALLSKPAPPAIDPLQQQANMLAMMVSMKEMFKPEKSTGSDIDTLLKGLELGKEIMGGNSSGADWTDVLIRGFDTVKPVLTEAMKNAQVARPMQARATPAPRALGPPLPVQTAPVQTAPVDTDPVKTGTTETDTVTTEEKSMLNPQVLTWLTHITKGLVLQASRNKSAELYAEVFLDNLPDFVTSELIQEHFSDDNALDKLTMINADVKKFRPWFEEFRDSVLDFLTDAQDEANEEPPELDERPDIDSPADLPPIASDDSHLD